MTRTKATIRGLEIVTRLIQEKLKGNLPDLPNCSRREMDQVDFAVRSVLRDLEDRLDRLNESETKREAKRLGEAGGKSAPLSQAA